MPYVTFAARSIAETGCCPYHPDGRKGPYRSPQIISQPAFTVFYPACQNRTKPGARLPILRPLWRVSKRFPLGASLAGASRFDFSNNELYNKASQLSIEPPEPDGSRRAEPTAIPPPSSGRPSTTP